MRTAELVPLLMIPYLVKDNKYLTKCIIAPNDDSVPPERGAWAYAKSAKAHGIS